MDEQQDLLGSTAVFNKFIHNKLYLLRLLPCHFFMSCLEKRFAQPKKIRKIMIGTDLNIKPVTCGLPAKQSQPSAVKLVEIHVGIILSETKKLVFFWNKTCFTSCLMRSFPIYIYIWIHLMDVQKVPKKTQNFNTMGWNLLQPGHFKICRRQWRPWSNCWIQTLELLRFEWDGCWEGGNWYLYLYTWKNPQKSIIDMYR